MLAALRSGKHPDSRPPYQIGTPGPLFAHTRIFVDPFPMLPKSGGSGRRGVDLTQPEVPSSGSGPSLSQPNVLGRGKRDLTPVPQPIDFLSAYGKPKAPRIRSHSPNPYDHPPPLDACQPPPPQTASENSEGRVCGAVEVVAIDLCEVSPSLEGPASTELAQVIDASGESWFRSPSPSPLLPPSAPVFSAQDQQPSPLHDALPSGVSSAMGIPLGGPPEQVDTTDVGVASLNSNMNSVTPVGASGFLKCIGCSTSFVPIQGEECYGKCQECLSSFLNIFARMNCPQLFSSPLHDSSPPGVSDATGVPLGGSPEPGDTPDGDVARRIDLFPLFPSVPFLHDAQPPGTNLECGGSPGGPSLPSVNPDGGAAGPCFPNSICLAMAPSIPCGVCGVTFLPTLGKECDSTCAVCALLPPPKRVRITGKMSVTHRKARPPS